MTLYIQKLIQDFHDQHPHNSTQRMDSNFPRELYDSCAHTTITTTFPHALLCQTTAAALILDLEKNPRT